MATTRIHIGPADRGRPMTLEEFREAEEEPGYLYELARGALEVTEIPGDWHRQVVHNAHHALTLYSIQHPGLILCIGHGSDIRFQIPELRSDRHPDLGVVFRATRPDSRNRRQATLAVEVVSPGKPARKRDYEEKREEYPAVGIREYWIIDPDSLQVMVLVRREGQGGPSWEERTFRDDQIIGSEILPGFVGRASELWTDMELAGDEGEGAE
jgi:Uma2 family endonuclease